MTALPSLTVACTNSQCRHQGVARRIMLPQIAPGVLAVPDLRCAGCGNQPPIVEGGNNMPKISVHGGATNAAEDTADASEGSEQPSPGTSSSTSSKKDETSPQQSEPAPSRPARTTGNRSKRGPAGSSARGTDGGRTAATSASDEDEDGSGASDTA
jgi:hypothetical protein